MDIIFYYLDNPRVRRDEAVFTRLVVALIKKNHVLLLLFLHYKLCFKDESNGGNSKLDHCFKAKTKKRSTKRRHFGKSQKN